MERTSNYQYMIQDSGKIGKECETLTDTIDSLSHLDPKTFHLICLAYLAANNMAQDLIKHVICAKKAGCTRKEIQSVLHAGLPICGAKLANSYAIAMDVYDENL